MGLLSAFLLSALLAAASAPPRLTSGALPPPVPSNIVGGGEVLLEVDVDAQGRVADVRTLRDTTPYTALLRRAVAGWTFSGATRTPVLVAGVFRPPTVAGPTLGEVPRDVAAPTRGTPHPEGLVPPAYPVQASGDAAVLIEVALGPTAGAQLTVRQGPPLFDAAAVDAVRKWTWSGLAEPAYAYVVVSFRTPVATPPGSLAIPR